MKDQVSIISLRIIIILTLLTPAAVGAQTVIGGNVLNRKSHTPIANVSVCLNKKKKGSVSDTKGHFVMPVSGFKSTDTLVLSSVGYSTLKIPLSDAMLVREFFLTEEAKQLDDIVIKTYTNHRTEGSLSEVDGYFSSWTTQKDGGEIGRMIRLKSNEIKIEKIRFKANSQCDTCFIRLHIRSLNNGLPYMDLLQDSTTIQINRSSFDDKYAEFDLSQKNIIIKNHRYLFISLETIRCNSANNGSCTLAYIGTEEGRYLFRTRDYRDWEESNSNSLYLKLFYSY